MENWLSFSDLVKGIWEILCGIFGIIIGYFLPIRDMVNFIVILFFIDMVFGYWAAKKLRGEKFSKGIVYKTTMLRMLISILIVMVAYTWDTTFKQQFIQTYNMAGWFISGVLIFSIVKNAFKITKWQVFDSLTTVFARKVKDQTGVDISEIDLK